METPLKGLIKQDEDLKKQLERRSNTLGLVCYNRGYHNVSPLLIKKKIPVFDEYFDWWRCCDCNAITFTFKK
jgi:hypothetical protein